LIQLARSKSGLGCSGKGIVCAYPTNVKKKLTSSNEKNCFEFRRPKNIEFDSIKLVVWFERN
jgi:hypothetical protein